MAEKFIGLAILALIFIPLESMFTLRAGRPWQRAQFGNDLLHFFVNSFLVQVAVIALVAVPALAIRATISPGLQAAVAAQPGWLQFAEALLLLDFTTYWWHRFTHRHAALWKFHAVHHSSAAMDWLAAARLHPLDQAMTRALQFIPLFWLGFSRETFGGAAVLLGLHAIFLHANVRLRFGWLKYVISTPEFHHWHHGGDAEARDKNFAGFLPLWDWLFGTLYLPQGRMPETYGVREPVPAAYLAQLAWPFRRYGR